MANRFEQSETLPKYFKELNKMSDFMTKEDERKLADRIQKGGPDGELALVQLVQPNLKFVVTLANSFIGMGLSIDDLIQEGNIGLMEAARRFTSDHDTKFLTYAKFWIKKRLNLALCDHGRTVRLPVNQEYQIYKERVNGAGRNLKNVRIDLKVSKDQDESIGDILLRQEFQDPFEKEDETRVLLSLLGCLKKSEREIVELFYGIGDGEPLSTKDVADLVGKTPTEVNRALKVARAKMRKRVNPIK